MSWTCQLLDIVGTEMVRYNPPVNNIVGTTMLVKAGGQLCDWKDLSVGTMFFLPKDADMGSWPWYNAVPDRLSDYYKQNNAHRQPLFVVLPGRELFLIDGKCWEGSVMYGGWTVTGEAPNITVSPSINIKGFYHGYLQNGVVAADCEGRQYDAHGNRPRSERLK